MIERDTQAAMVSQSEAQSVSQSTKRHPGQSPFSLRSLIDGRQGHVRASVKAGASERC